MHEKMGGMMVQQTQSKSGSALQHLGYLDGWRGVAIVLLLMGHFFPYWRLSLGTAGVNLFFVLSGLLMAQLLFVKTTPISIFYKRRISRIMPSLYVFIFLILAIYGLLGLPISISESIGALALVRNYYPQGFGNVVPFDHIWSLSVEEHSYILLSIIAVLDRKGVASAKWMIGLCAAGALITCAVYSIFKSEKFLYSHWLIHSEVSSFAILISAYFVLYFQDRPIVRIPAFVFPMLLFIGVAMHHYKIPQFFTLALGVTSFALMVNVIGLAPTWMLRIFSFSVLRLFGVMSFSIYLWQQPFFVLKKNGILSAEAGLLAGIVTGLFMYYFVEKPFRAYLNRTWSKNTPR